MTGGRVTRNGDTYYMAGGFEMCLSQASPEGEAM